MGLVLVGGSLFLLLAAAPAPGRLPSVVLRAVPMRVGHSPARTPPAHTRAGLLPARTPFHIPLKVRRFLVFRLAADLLS